MAPNGILIHGLKTCDTTRAAVRALKERGGVLVDLRDTPMTRDILMKWMEEFGPGLVNRSSATWRGLTDEERARAPIDLIAAHPALIKRPVIEDGDKRTIGWSPQVQRQWLGGAD